MWYTLGMGKPESRAAYPLCGGANSPVERKEKIANDYICRIDTVLYIDYCPCKSVLSDIQGETIAAAITTNNDGCLH